MKAIVQQKYGAPKDVLHVSSIGQPIVLTGAPARAAAAHHDGLRACVGLTTGPT